MLIRQKFMIVIALLWMSLVAFLLLSNTRPTSAAAATLSTGKNQAVMGKNKSASTGKPAAALRANAAARPKNPAAIAAPYPRYTVTQGPHGFSYGQMAIDLTAGNGAPILSPINGTVTQLFVDELGNTTLVIENELYQVTLMHGDYTVSVGQQLQLGDPVGTESNNGNTVDWAGRSCRGRDCGYHTHLNIFDKRTGENVNPLDLIAK